MKPYTCNAQDFKGLIRKIASLECFKRVQIFFPFNQNVLEQRIEYCMLHIDANTHISYVVILSQHNIGSLQTFQNNRFAGTHIRTARERVAYCSFIFNLCNMEVKSHFNLNKTYL